MLVRDKKHFVKGLLMLITFGILFCALLFPIMRDERGNHLTGLQYADNVFNNSFLVAPNAKNILIISSKETLESACSTLA